MSNIAKVFNPPPSRDLQPEEYEDCLPCQIMATFSALGAGWWFASGRVFHDEKLTQQESLKLNPIWWRNTVRAGGIGLLFFGVYRGTEGLLWGRSSSQTSEEAPK